MVTTLTDLAPLANHLWQSTLCAATVWCLALGLKKNRAAVRYWLWLSASAKFLIPFSLLVSLGTHVGWRTVPATITTQPTWSTMVGNLGQPFVASPSVFHPVARTASYRFPSILFGVWLCGLAVSLAFWFRNWRQIRSAQKSATPLPLGLPIPVMSSPARVEPGVVGIYQPALLLPKGIESRLTPEQLTAVLAHEMCHVRRRDNLTAAIHMIVEAVFWFYPLLWWIRARLVEERERACYEAVLYGGSNAEAYAEGILKVCKFYFESPLSCVSGVTGANLRRRVVRIMSDQLAENLSFGRKALLGAVVLATVGAPLVLGLVNGHSRLLVALVQDDGTPVSNFEVATIKPSLSGDDSVSLLMSPGKFSTHEETVREVVEFAYDIKSDQQLLGGPSWINSEKYDIEAKEDPSVADKLQKLPFEEHAHQIRLMVQLLLTDRFRLKVSHQTKDVPVYALLVSKNGPKLTPSAVESLVDAKSAPRRTIRMQGPGQLSGTNDNLALLVDALSRQPELGRLVIDQTGLTGNYDWTLKWTPDRATSMFKGSDGGTPANASAADPSGLSIFSALEEQLGLKLEPRKGPVDTLVIENIEKPSKN